MDFGAVTFEEDNKITLQSGDSPRSLRGMDALIQEVIIELFSDPVGTGGGSGFVTALQGTPLGSSDIGSSLNARIRTAQENIFGYQKEARLSDDRRLRSLTILAIRENQNPGWEVDIRIENVSGEVETRAIR
jgi:hypothetical protein